jgi:hypothetical protein
MSQSIVNPWNIKESDFPTEGTTTAKLEFLLNYAVLAPSGHNTQPWRFQVRNDAIELYGDSTRSLPIVDPDNRALIISCGAALFYLRLAIRHFGYEDVVEYFKIFPDSMEFYPLARITLGDRIKTTAEQHFLFRAIQTRQTYRRPFLDQDIPSSLISELQDAASSQHSQLEIVSASLRQTVVGLIVEGDRQQMANPQFRRELAKWVRSGHNSSHDGMPAYAQGVDEHLDLFTPLVALAIRWFDLGEFQSHKDRHLAQTAPVLAMLATDDNRPGDWLAAGQALARVLLQARGSNIWASFLNQPIEVPELRMQLQKVLQTKACPQILLRLGYGTDIKPTPRRAVNEVLQSTIRA